jgi:predicted dehydrogenase
MGALAAAPLVVPRAVLGLGAGVAPNDRIQFGCIGVGNRARHVMPSFLAQEDIRFVAVSDCRADRLESARELMNTHYGDRACRTYHDYRELLEQRDVDAVFIATGDRWHATASIHAARARKDIYSEKPISMYVAEGRALVEECRRTGAVYQGGTQRRSTASYRFAVEMARRGVLGRVHTVEMQVWTGPVVARREPAPVPPGWDFDRWLGPAAWHPYTPGRDDGVNWNYFWDTGEGPMIGMGCHYTDQMQWALRRDDTGPVEFEGTCTWPDPTLHMSETPVLAEARCRYADGVVGVLHQRGTFAERYIRFIGDQGWIQVDDETNLVSARPESILDLRRNAGVSWADAGGHVRNLLDSIRTRRPTICHPEAAHRAQTICQAINIALRLGRKLAWDPAKERFDCEEANRMLTRPARAPWGV